MAFNWVDIVVLIFLAYAVYVGIRVGLLTLLLIFAGFFLSLFAAGWLYPHLIPIQNKTLKAIINGNLVLVTAAYFSFKGLDLGRKLHLSINKKLPREVESVSGILISFSTAVIIVWLVAAEISSLPFAGLSNSVSDAFFIQTIDRMLPAPPQVLAEFDRFINPNSPPNILIKKLSNSSISAAPLPAVTGAVEAAGNSVVRITSFGCGGVVGGSGFAIAPDIVMTDAHVIAGVKDPVVKYGNQSYSGVPILFDPNTDLAALLVNGLNAAPLIFNSNYLASGTAIYTIGYPKSIYTITVGKITKTTNIATTSIYGYGSITQNVYLTQTTVNDGDSGGPIVTANGEVAGIILAKLTHNYVNYAYALTSPSLHDRVYQAEHTTRRVNTGVCFS